MKKDILILTLLLSLAGLAQASLLTDSQAVADSSRSSITDGTWTTSSTPALKMDENYYSNWAATGISQISFVGTFNGNYTYTHKKFTWDNVADLALGVTWQDLMEKSDTIPALFDTRRKNDDKIDLTSTLSMRLRNMWNMNATINLKTQFMDGFTYADPLDKGTLVSSFMAPGYLTTALGFEYKKLYWNLSLSFLTGKTTFLLDQNVIDAGQLYGVDTTGGKRLYAGLGSYIKFYYKKDIAKNLNLYTRVELFYDYRKPKYHDGIAAGEFGSWVEGDATANDTWLKENGASALARTGHSLRYDTDIDWELKLEYRFSSFLAAYFTTRFRYDSDFNGKAPLFGRDECPWQFYQGAGVQLYFNWKTPKKA